MHQSSKCMRCKSSEELSIKYRTKLGAIRYMCRPCRRTEYYALKETHINDPDENRRIRWIISWSMLADEINGRIINKYSRIRL